MKNKDLRVDKYIKDWLSGVSAKPTTKKGYIDSMRAYTEFLNKTPEQIIDEAEDDIESGKLMRKRAIFNDLREFREHLESSGLAPMSVKAKITGVRSFFTYNNIDLPALPRSKTSASPLMENRAIPTKDDVIEILNVADPLEKALLLTGASSGLAINEISNITVLQFMEGYDEKTEITTLHMIREKVGYEFYTFISPEASRAIWKYLSWRQRDTERTEQERINQRIKQKIKYDKNGIPVGYLFISRAIVPEYIETGNEELRKLRPETIQKIYSELNVKANKASPKGKRNLIRSHNMRKFFNSTLLANGADIFTTDFMMGHKIDATKDAYFRADPNSLKKKYINFVPYLTIQKELNVAESPEFKKLKDENEILARETAKATVERAEIQDLRAKIDEMEKRKAESSEISKEFLLKALLDPDIQEMLKSNSK